MGVIRMSQDLVPFCLENRYGATRRAECKNHACKIKEDCLFYKDVVYLETPMPPIEKEMLNSFFLSKHGGF